MKPKSRGHIDTAAKIAALEGMKWIELKALWADLFGREPGINNRRYVERRLTHRLQEEAARHDKGELLSSNERRIRHLIDTGRVRPRSGSTARQGTVLTREYQGVLHSVRVLDNGTFEYAGQAYRSLSAIARQITGTQWSGPAFFGLRGIHHRKEGRK
ncbi:DUF2924 domain-containing protein [Lysobacter enzymogenes]|uniref:DUF2924 domain-containing protein n=1 Tax=Lysobacter enzymogenes TaxID=69 RepID=UPI001AFAB801|nr:DUF2924 domain-containing protein [Lysobacter enzymogenes]QQQ01005.1 DUF2924 domain-containing protein [Lysobacter enzymogenes]